MKPLKSGLVLATWLMRITLVIYLFLMFYPEVKLFEFSSRAFYIAAGFILFSSLCILGGFMAKDTLTVISGFVLFMLAGYKIGLLIANNGVHSNLIAYLVPASVGFYFLTAGNQK